jgi:agmatine deiminase
MNFVIANGVIVMPCFEDVYAPKAAEALAALFPGREVIALPSRSLLGVGGDAGGGSFHCITQQESA